MTFGESPVRAARPDCPSLCLVCGLDYRSSAAEGWPWGPDGTLPGFHFCACCDVEFGYQDATLDGCRTARRRWIEAGHQWSDPSARPAGWNAQTQLAAIPARAR
ncbi:MAG TPA: hypothetical protein VN408_32140 [Actinoplanes sp.]|nr:hypothetical protein [Actinoplanes sp.]